MKKSPLNDPAFVLACLIMATIFNFTMSFALTLSWMRAVMFGCGCVMAYMAVLVVLKMRRISRTEKNDIRRGRYN